MSLIKYMRYLPQLLCAVGFLALVFGYWGVKTVSGRRQFDEMAGMIPMAAGFLGAVCVLGGILWLILRLRS